MRMNERGVLPGVALAMALFATGVLGQSSAVDEIAKYRAALQDGNPAELWEARGAARRSGRTSAARRRLRSSSATWVSVRARSRVPTRSSPGISPTPIA